MSERLGDLTSRERELVDAVASGEVLSCSQLTIEQLSATDDPEHTIRAELLRELLLKRCGKPLDPRGVRLRGARITGTLDLSHVQAAVGVELRGCSLDGPVLLEDAHIPWLTLSGCAVAALDGNGLQVNGNLNLGKLRVTGRGELGAVRLVGAHITGLLSLTSAELTNESGSALLGDGLQVDGDLYLEGTIASGRGERGAIRLARAHIRGELGRSGANLTNEDGPALDGEELQVDGSLFLNELRASGRGGRGAVRLVGARIRGEFVMSGGKLTNEDGPALHGDGLEVNGGMLLQDEFRAIGRGERFAVRLVGAHIAGVLSLRGAELTNEDGSALVGDWLQVDRGLFLDRGFHATGRGELGAVRLPYARITGELGMSGAVLTNESGPALDGDGLQVDGDVFLRELRAIGGGKWGAVRLPGAHITGQLTLEGAELTNETSPALVGDGLQVDGDLFLTGLTASGRGELGAVRLPGTRITGKLTLTGAELTNTDGPALYGDGLAVDGGMRLHDGFRAIGHGECGAVGVRAARIRGLSLMGAELTNDKGPALDGYGLQVDGGLSLDKGSRATGRGKLGAVRLVGAHITGQLGMSGALTNDAGPADAGPALDGGGLQVDGHLSLGDGFRATGGGERGVVRLVGARITGELSLRDAQLTNTQVTDADLTNKKGLVLDLAQAEANWVLFSPQVICSQADAGSRFTCDGASRLRVSGFVYTSLYGSRWDQWLHLITHHTNEYGPQPYQQLAAVQRSAGHDADARKILIAQQQDLRTRGELGGWLTKTMHRLWRTLAGYGYRTRRTAVALLVVLLAAGGLGIAAGHTPTSPGRYVAMHTPQADTPGASCSLLEQVGVGIDRGLPLATTGIRSRCDFDTTSHWGQTITAATWILQALVWALATLVVVGYTGLIRKAT